jgi:hypothetical protein
MSGRVLLAVMFALVALAPARAWAFHVGSTFAAAPGAGGAGRIYYLGTALERGWDCTMCHSDAPGLIEAHLDVDPPELFASFQYTPERRYRFAVRLVGEHRGLNAGRSNLNGLALAFVDDAGIYQGELGGFDATEFFDGSGVLVSAGTRIAAADWTFEWTAPASGIGRVTLHLGLVDGNGAGSTGDLTRTDPFGDDVFMVAVRFDEGANGASAARTEGLAPFLTVPSAIVPPLPSMGCKEVWMRMPWLGSTLALSLALALGSASCGDESTSSDAPCPQGICSGGAQGGSTSAGNGGQSGCAEAWLCSPWDTAGNGDVATRVCVDGNRCGTSDAKPVETATLPALDENFYRCNVEPIFDRTCAHLGCHGVEPDLAAGDPGRALRTYHRGRLRIVGELLPPESGCLNDQPLASEICIGSIECECWTKPHTTTEWQRNFDAARGFGLAPDGTPLSSAEESELLTQPLKGGGLAHAGIKVWTRGDSDFATIRAWLEGQTTASCSTTN